MSNPSSTPPSAAMEPRTYTELEMILAQRAAFRNGARFIEANHRASLRCRESSAMEGSKEYMAAQYPLPKVQRPRVVVDSFGWSMRVYGSLDYRYIETKRRGSCEWEPCHVDATPERVALWADLFANPTELVDEAALSPGDGAET